MKYVFFILGLLVLTSCLDMSKQQHLDQLSNLDKRIDSIQVEFEQLKKDTIEEIIYTMKETNIKIKDNIGDDTIDLETAKKLEDYGKIFRQLSAVEGYNNKILFGSQEVKNSVEKLYRDIESGNGERVNYEKFVKFETKKVKELHSLLIDLERVQRENIQAFKKVNPEIEKFLSSLSEN
jgi:vacuolar-type H+-ATPase subunit I/STV1